MQNIELLQLCTRNTKWAVVLVFYNNYIRFCAKVGKSPSAVAEEIGLYKSTVTNWKNRGTKPTDATLQRVADYFGVTVEELLEENRKPAPTNEGELDARYFDLTPENRALIDSMIEKLLKSQSDD